MITSEDLDNMRKYLDIGGSKGSSKKGNVDE